MKRRSNESGQALIEYISLLFISILIIGGIVYQFNDAFRQYLNAWFESDEGGYLFCLIQNGYLPGESDVCTLPTFNMQKGKKLLADGIGGTGSGGGAGNGHGQGANAGGNSGLQGLRANESSGGALIPSNSADGFGANGKDSAGGKKGTGSSTGNDGFSGGGGGFAGQGAPDNNVAFGNRSRMVPFKDKLGGNVKSNENVPITDKDLQSPHFVAAEKLKRKQMELQDANSNFSFGKILKYIITLMICFSILFFVGSQLLAISKGNKKRG